MADDRARSAEQVRAEMVTEIAAAMAHPQQLTVFAVDGAPPRLPQEVIVDATVSGGGA